MSLLNETQNYTILLIDDDPDYHFLIEHSIKEFKLPIQLVTAYNGVEAMNYFLKKNGSADLIISDINMPLMNGFDFLKNIKSHPQLSRFPVFFLTSCSEPDTKLKSIELGAIQCYEKPIDMSEYKPILTEIIKSSKSIQQ